MRSLYHQAIFVSVVLHELGVETISTSYEHGHDETKRMAPVGATTPRQHFEPWGGDGADRRERSREGGGNESHGIVT
jgi:hypothetical protein